MAQSRRTAKLKLVSLDQPHDGKIDDISTTAHWAVAKIKNDLREYLPQLYQEVGTSDDELRSFAEDIRKRLESNLKSIPNIQNSLVDMIDIELNVRDKSHNFSYKIEFYAKREYNDYSRPYESNIHVILPMKNPPAVEIRVF